MGACHCHFPVRPYKYDLRKQHPKTQTNPLPSVRTPVKGFDSLKRTSTSISPRSNAIETPTSRTSDEVFTFDADLDAKLRTVEGSQYGSHSDLGSECLSVAYSSARSHVDRMPGNHVTSSRDSGHVRSTDKTEVMVINSLSSADAFSSLGTKDSRCMSPADGRPYVCSRLDNRSESKLSAESREILQWKRGNKLGRGSFGTVWLGLTVTGELVAVKQIELMETDLHEAEKEYTKIYDEVSLLRSLKHQNIVGYYGSSYEDNTISVFMQYVPGGSIASILQRFGPLEEAITTHYSRQLLHATAYLHANDIVHRDIKSANIMLMPDGTIKLIDFGCAKRLAMKLSKSGSHLQQSLRGTPYWMAPEVINETGHGKKSDIWSIGCTIFEMFTGTPPWGDREPFAAIYAIGSEEFEVPTLPDSFSVDSREFVRLCMIRNKHRRPTASRLMKHPFVSRPSSGASVASRTVHIPSQQQKRQDAAGDIEDIYPPL